MASLTTYPDARPSRDLVLFLCGPGLLAVAVAVAYALHPWPVPVAPQARLFQPLGFGPVLAFGALSVWLSSRVGLPSAPARTDGRGWARLLSWSVALGLALTAVSVVADAQMGLAKVAAQAIGQRSMNVAFPVSIGHYAFGSVIEESMLHLAPVPILCWLIGLPLQGRWRMRVFWIVAGLISLVEPIGQAMMLAPRAPALAASMAGVELAGNLLWMALFRRFGWPAPFVVRLTMELGWHVAWPLLSPG